MSRTHHDRNHDRSKNSIEILLARSVAVMMLSGIFLSLVAIVLPVVFPNATHAVNVLTIFFTFNGTIITGYLTYRTRFWERLGGKHDSDS